MPTLSETVEILEQFAPLALAEDWDNVGLLVGNRERPVRRLMTCLTLTRWTVDEAVRENADLVVVHHPLPFRPIHRITSDSSTGRMLLALIEAQVAVYSPHTAFDSAREGINQRLANGMLLKNVRPLVPSSALGVPELGAGRIGDLEAAISLADVTTRLRTFLDLRNPRVVGDPDSVVRRIAIACGSGGSFLPSALSQQADCLVTGETNFHSCLDAESAGICLLLLGHFASERFALECLANALANRLPDVLVWAARQERDPLNCV